MVWDEEEFTLRTRWKGLFKNTMHDSPNGEWLAHAHKDGLVHGYQALFFLANFNIKQGVGTRLRVFVM